MRCFADHWISLTCRFLVTTLLLSTAARAGDITAFVDDGRLCILGSSESDEIVVNVEPGGALVTSYPLGIHQVNGQPQFETDEAIDMIMAFPGNGSDRFQLNLTADLPGGLFLDDHQGDDGEEVCIPIMPWLDEGVPVSLGPVNIATGSGSDWVRLVNPNVEYTDSVNVKCNSGNDRIDLDGILAGEVLTDLGGGTDDVFLHGQYQGPVVLRQEGGDFDVFPVNIVSDEPIQIISGESTFTDIVISTPWEDPSPIVGSDGRERLIFSNVNQVAPIVFESGADEDSVILSSSNVEELTIKSDIAMYLRADLPGEFGAVAASRLNTLNVAATSVFTTTNMDVGDFNLETLTSEDPLLVQHMDQWNWVSVELKDSLFETMNVSAAQGHDRIELWDCQVNNEVSMTLSDESPRLLMVNSRFLGPVRLESEDSRFSTIHFGGCDFMDDVEIIGADAMVSIRNFVAGTHSMEYGEPVTIGPTTVVGDFIMELHAQHNDLELQSLNATRLFIDLWSGSDEILINDSQFDEIELNCRNAVCDVTLEKVVADLVEIDFGNGNDDLELKSNVLGMTDFRGNGGSDRIRGDGNNSFDDLVFDGFETVDVPEDEVPAGGFAPSGWTIPVLHNPVFQTATSSSSGSNYSISATTSSSFNTAVSSSQLSTSSLQAVRVMPSRSTSTPVKRSTSGRMRLAN